MELKNKASNLFCWIKTHASDLAIMLLIVLVGKVYIHKIDKVIDIGLQDETYYLSNGLDIAAKGLPPAYGYPHGAPLYAIWYWFLSFIKSDAIELYYLNYKTTVVLPVLFCFVFLRASHVSRLFSICITFILLTSAVNFPVWPRISHFALAILFCGLAVSTRLLTAEAKLSWSAIVVLLASYVRPEFFLAFIFLWVVICLLACFRLIRSYIKLSVYPIAASMVVSTLLIVLMGVPFGSMNRSWDAFKQHYSFNAVKWTSSDVNPWLNADVFVDKTFPGANSVMGALKSNPVAFGKHLWSNITQLPSIFLALFSDPYPHSSVSNSSIQVACVIFLLLGLIHTQRKTLSQMIESVSENVKRRLWSLLIMVLLLIPPLLSTVFIYPRHHYVLFLVFIPISIILVFSSKRDNNQRETFSALLVCFLVLFTIRPVSAQILSRNQPNLSVIHFLRSLHVTQPVDILDANEGYGVYVGKNYRMVESFRKKEGFDKFIRIWSIDMIVVSDDLRNDSRFKDDKEWKAFLAKPSSFGFTPFPIEDASNQIVLVRNYLLNDGQSIKGHRQKSEEKLD